MPGSEPDELLVMIEPSSGSGWHLLPPSHARRYGGRRAALPVGGRRAALRVGGRRVALRV
jgi:hypothetical protein